MALGRVADEAPARDAGGLTRLYVDRVFTLRGIGIVVVGVVVATARDGSSRFRSGLGIDALVERWVPEGRTTEGLVIGWVVAVFVVAGSLWLTPAPFPLLPWVRPWPISPRAPRREPPRWR